MGKGFFEKLLLGDSGGKGSPQTTLVTLTAAGRKKAENFDVGGRDGDILHYLLHAQPASLSDIALNCNLETRSVRTICEQWSKSSPSLCVIGGK